MRAFFLYIIFISSLFAETQLNKAESLNFSPLDGINMWQYAGVIFILLGLLIVLWYVKTRLNTPQKRNFLDNLLQKDSTKVVEIESITNLNIQNKLIIFSAYNKRYIVLLGQNGATLLDSYSKENFNDMLNAQ